ncbi:hypothetical protein PCCS19_16620 [Paenibacillus sp. CCS19]|uniref:Ig-like domain-containing protein n=1 Tax=Paenibacillus sp. CCS19 TaxID=3158387 RepID=UPI002563A9B5|nr:S-layer homology domain-containing protein [Paenibacillus cellulosilyticus]GMK38608.1 hypothetical protein PCCS19_16620 [Paenibacillus cellulosilyticus]
MLSERTNHGNKLGRKSLRNQLLAITLTGAMLSGSLLVPPSQAEAAVDPGSIGAVFMTDTDNWGGGAASSVADGDLDLSLKNQNKATGDNYAKYPIDFKITGVTKKPVKSAQLLIRAYDVDEYKEALAASGEWDRVYFSSEASDIALGSSYTTWPTSSQWNTVVKASGIGTDSSTNGANYKKEMPQRAYLGTLSGQDARWNTTVLSFSPTEFDRIGLGDNFVGVTIHHYYQDVRTTSSTPNTNWSMTIDWGQLIIDGGDRATGEITKTGLKVEKGKVTVDTSFLPKVTGNNFAGEVNVIEKAVVNGQVIERNLGIQQKLFPTPAVGTEVNWNNITISDTGIDPAKEYIVNVVLFDDRGSNGGAKDTTSGTNPGKAEHVVTFSTLDPIVQDFAKSGLRSAPTAFTKADFQNHYFKLNGGAANGTNLQSVRISELPDSAKGSLQLNGTPVTAGQLIPAGDLPNLAFVPVAAGFDGTVTFKWNGFNGTKFATDDATVTINSSPEVQDFVKIAKFGDFTLPITLGDFTAHYIDPGSESIEGVKVVTLPDSSKGKLALDNGSGQYTDITEGQELSLTQAAHVVFIPETDATGTTSFQWNGSDGLQFAHESKTVTIIINRPPVVQDIVMNGQKGNPTAFSTNDFAKAASFEDADGDTLQQARITVPTGFASIGTLKYTKTGAGNTAIAPGQTAVLTANELATLVFTPVANLADGVVPAFTWIGSDGMHDSTQSAQVKINYNGIPTAAPVTYTVDEGTPAVNVVLQGSDAESASDKLAYVIEAAPTHGTLAADSTNPHGAAWIYTPDNGFTGKESFTYSVIDEGNQKSTPADVVIDIQKPLDGWVGNKQQGDPTVVKAQPDHGLQLSAISSHLAASVTANVDGTAVPLQLSNASTWQTDGYKLWVNTTFVLPSDTTSGTHTVTFTASDTLGAVVQTELPLKLADNKFYIAAAGLPTASTLDYTDNEGAASIKVTLQGSDPETTSDKLTYTIEGNPTKGTLTKDSSDSSGTKWIYTPSSNFKSGTDTFTYTVTDEDDHKSANATVTIHIQKPLEGWVGDKLQGDSTIIKAQPDHALKLSAISSHLAASVTANVDGASVSLQLVNASTWVTDGYKKWENTTFVLPSDTASGNHTVTFTAANATNPALQTEASDKLTDNKFYIAAAGLPTAVPLVYTDNEGAASINVKLQGNDPETPQNKLTVTIESDPSKGTLTSDPTDLTGTLWIYTLAAGFTSGTDSFTYSVTDEDDHKSTPVTVIIHIQKPLEGWVGDKQQGDPTVIKSQPDRELKLAAISSHLAAFVTADVDGTPVQLQLANAATWAADGYKLWENTTFVLPAGTAGGNHTVTFTAADATITVLQTESSLKLADNKFYVAAAGLPTAVPLVYTNDEGTASINVTLQGNDPETTSDYLIYTIESDPAKGTLTKEPSDSTGTQWIYTPTGGFTAGVDSFAYTVTDEDDHKSAPVEVTINLQKPLEGWVGDKGQGEPTIIKTLPEQQLKLSAISSHLAQAVTANVDGSLVPLQLVNGSTYLTDGYKQWVNTIFTLPESTQSGTYTVTFTAADAANAELQTESQTKLGDNKFKIAAADLALTADPKELLGDGKSTTVLTAVLTDEDGTPVEGVAVNFTAPAGQGLFIGGSNAVTDAQGRAEVTYRSPQITGVVEQHLPIQAVVYDPVRGLSAKDEIIVTFMPASVEGIVTRFDSKSNKNIPVQGAGVRVTLDLNGDGVIVAGVDFDETVLTDENGAYKVIVPKGNVIYNVDIVQPVQVGDTTKQVSYHQTAAVGEVTGSGEEKFTANETITGIAFMQQSDGSRSLLTSDMTSGMSVYVKRAGGDYILDGSNNPKAFAVDVSGVFHADGLTVGDYELEFRYVFDSGKEIVIGKGAAKVSATGEMNIAEELIDPYGTITDADTHAVIENAKVVLTYADTGAVVNLPPIVGFAPNDNASPVQYSDASGLYAYMVYPDTDYVLTVSKDGYVTYTSPVISVGKDIVKHDIQLRKTPAYVPPVAVEPKASLSLNVDANTVKEGGQTQVTVTYKNDSSTSLSSGQVKVTLPEGAVVVDAAGGKVNGNAIVWDVANVAGGQSGSMKLTVQWPLLEQSELAVSIQAEFNVSGVNVKASTPIHIYSDRFGELSHYRYILGYPDKQFKPNGSLTRAELAAIVARLTDNSDIAYTLPYTDIREGHWATRYIKVASKYGLFSGYQDGTFRPDAPVTRAELAAVMARFLKINVGSSALNHFNDTTGHWAGSIIEALYNGKFLTGYPDGSFKPNDKIKRAEAVTMINRMLYRGPLTGLAPIFPDMPSSHWAFGDVQEATVSHISVHNEEGGENWKDDLEDDVK